MLGRLLAVTAGLVVGVLAGVAAGPSSATSQPGLPRSLVVEEATIAVRQPGPHDGGGDTTAFPFFANVSDFRMAFRKRILHKGSTIGYHLQDFDEVYYILSGTGEYTLNGVRRQVGPGAAMLTRPGDSHGLRPTGDGELTLIIAFPTPTR